MIENAGIAWIDSPYEESIWARFDKAEIELSPVANFVLKFCIDSFSSPLCPNGQGRTIPPIGYEEPERDDSVEPDQPEEGVYGRENNDVAHNDNSAQELTESHVNNEPVGDISNLPISQKILLMRIGSDEHIRKITSQLDDPKLILNEKLQLAESHQLIEAGKHTSIELGKMFGVSDATIRQQTWWKNNKSDKPKTNDRRRNKRSFFQNDDDS